MNKSALAAMIFLVISLAAALVVIVLQYTDLSSRYAELSRKHADLSARYDNL